MRNEFTLKQVAIFLLLGVALIAIPLTVYLAQRQQDTRSRASVVSESTVVAIIDGQQITQAMVRQVAQEQNSPDTVDPEALKLALDVLIERRILDKAAIDLGIGVDQEKTDELLEDEFSKTDAKYESLRSQVTKRVVKMKEAVSVSFWNPPEAAQASLTDEEKTEVEAQLPDGLSALNSAKTRLEAGEEPIEIGYSLLDSHPKLENALAVNGYKVSSLNENDREIATYPIIYQFGDSGLDSETQTALFGMSVDQVVLVSNTSTNRGGVVFKLISSNDNGDNTYDEWLEQQKSSLVQNLNVL